MSLNFSNAYNIFNKDYVFKGKKKHIYNITENPNDFLNTIN